MPTANIDPGTYFKFKSCGRCLQKPCDRLRFGRVFPGKLILVHTRLLGSGFFDCPFVAQDPDEVLGLLENSSLLDLVDQVDGVMADLSISEQLIFKQEAYVNGYDDASGRIQFLMAMWNESVIGVVRVPLFITDKQMTRWLFALENSDIMLKNDIRPDEEPAAAVTDAMTEQPAEQAAANQTIQKGPFHIRLEIDPNSTEAQDDSFTLTSTDARKSYNKTLSVRDDQIPGDNYTDLTFTNLDKSLSYSLNIDLGREGVSFFLFQNKPYGELNAKK